MSRGGAVVAEFAYLLATQYVSSPIRTLEGSNVLAKVYVGSSEHVRSSSPPTPVSTTLENQRNSQLWAGAGSRRRVVVAGGTDGDLEPRGAVLFRACPHQTFRS